MITGNVPGHLIAGAKAGFLQAVRSVTPLWQQIASTMNLDGKTTELVDLGSAPMPTNSKTGVTIQDFIEKRLTVTPLDWDITVWISHNAMQDDRIGDLDRRVRSAGENFNLHMNSLVFKVLNAGDTTTYGYCYDGTTFFSNSHADSGAKYATGQDNLNGLALSLDNFETVYVAQSTRLDDQGEYMGIVPNVLVVPPALERLAAQIALNREAYDTANRETNPYAGRMTYVVAPWLDSTAWMLLSTTENVKPLTLVMREQPNLQHTWFDATAPDGGRYYFKFYARYNAAYGDWRLGTMGNT